MGRGPTISKFGDLNPLDGWGDGGKRSLTTNTQREGSQKLRAKFVISWVIISKATGEQIADDIHTIPYPCVPDLTIYKLLK